MGRLLRPVLAVGLLLGWMAVTVLTGQAPDGAATMGDVVMGGLLRQVAFAAAFLMVATALLGWEGLGLGRPRPGTWRLLWLPGLYLLLAGAGVAALGLPPPPALAILAANMLLVGLSEELMFRGVLYSGLRDRLPLWPAAIVTSVLFGAVHVLNAGTTGNLQGAVLQAINAVSLGFLLLGLRVRSGSLWPPVILHAVWNALLLLIGRDQPLVTADVDLPLAAQGALLAGILPLGLYGLWLLRRAARDGDGLGA